MSSRFRPLNRLPNDKRNKRWPNAGDSPMVPTGSQRKNSRSDFLSAAGSIPMKNAGLPILFRSSKAF